MAKPILDKDKLVLWDIETICNCTILCFKDYKTKKKREFIFYNSEEYAEEPMKAYNFLKSLQKNEYTLIGFNSINFDHQVIEYFLQNFNYFHGLEDVIAGIYSSAQEIIEVPEDKKHEFLIPEYKLSHKAIDLFKQKHYDGKAKRGTSLKWLQFSMRYPNIQEMPYTHDKELNKEHIKDVLDYCWNDVDSTEDFFTKIIFETELRETLSQTYSRNFLNASEPKLAKGIFAEILCKELNIEYTQLKDLRTFRTNINFKDIIFDYISFYTDKFNKILEDFKNVKIDASINSSDKFEYTFNIDDVVVDLGLGGIHGCAPKGVYTAEEDEMILDIDAKSYYPNLAIRNGLEPEQFKKFIDKTSTHPPSPMGDVKVASKFLKVYESLYNDRLKIPKENPLNYIYKIILNSN